MTMLLKTLAFQALDLKFADGGMKFSGYASKFGLVDSYGDTIAPGAYKDTLVGRDRPIRMRWNHYGPVIGKWLSIAEDSVGLAVEGELTPGHTVAMDTYASMKHGAVDGMSIGYYPVESETLGEGRTLLKKIQLLEVSVVEEPADLGATIDSVKSASTIREIETVLRDSRGFSKGSAQTLIARMKAVLQGELATEAKAQQEIAALFEKTYF